VNTFLKAFGWRDAISDPPRVREYVMVSMFPRRIALYGNGIFHCYRQKNITRWRAIADGDCLIREVEAEMLKLELKSNRIALSE
jgi:hypothetical protein